MPISCPVSFPHLTTEEFGALDYEVMAHAFASHKTLGMLADESVYQGDFLERLESAGFSVRREVPVTVSFRTFFKTYFLDAVVADKAVYELKTVTQLASQHTAQLINYLLMLDCRRGKLVNFRPASVDAQFVNAPLTAGERRSFEVHDARWRGDAATLAWMVEMLRDWGTALELPLYHEAIVHVLGGEAEVVRQFPMHRDGVPIGSQRFYMMETDAAFRITAFPELLPGYETHVRRLLAHSPLRAVHWINIAYRHVTFTTIELR